MTTIVWRASNGQPVYSADYVLTTERGKPILKLVRSFRHGPLAYRCMGPATFMSGPAIHGQPHGIWIRNYLAKPGLCYVPEGYKVCLQPAHVRQGPVSGGARSVSRTNNINVLPYFHLDHLIANGNGRASWITHGKLNDSARGVACRTAHPNLSESIYYRQVPFMGRLIRATAAELDRRRLLIRH